VVKWLRVIDWGVTVGGWLHLAGADTLTNTRWDMFDAMRDLQDHRRDAAASVLSRLSEVLTSDEHVVPLKSRLEELERDAMRLLTAAAPPPPAPEHLQERRAGGLGIFLVKKLAREVVYTRENNRNRVRALIERASR
jgi:hypothetical protein